MGSAGHFTSSQFQPQTETVCCMLFIHVPRLVGTCSNAQHNECKGWWKWNMTELLGNSFAQCCSAWPWLPVGGTVRRRNLSLMLLASTQMSQAGVRHVAGQKCRRPACDICNHERRRTYAVPYGDHRDPKPFFIRVVSLM